MKTRILILIGLLVLAGAAFAQANPPSGLEFTLQNDDDIQLTWNTPPQGEWITWAGEYGNNAIGTGAAATFEVAHRFATSDLGDYDGMMLSMVAFVPSEADCTYQIKVWTGGSQSGNSANHGTLVLTQDVPTVTLDEFNVVELDNPVVISSSEELWFGVAVDTNTGHPAGVDAGPSVAWKGDLMYWNNVWNRLTNLGTNLDYNWALRGFVETGAATIDGTPEVVELTTEPTPINNDPIQLSQTEPFSFQWNTRDLLGYTVYRDGGALNENLITETLYLDENLAPGLYDYYVTAVWDEGESEPSNMVEGVVPLMDNGNDTPEDATMLTLPREGDPYQIDMTDDEDWYVFEMQANTDLYAFTEVIGGSELDPEFYLYGPHNQDGSDVTPSNWIATDDDSNGDMQPSLFYPITSAGYYFLRVAYYQDDPTRDDIGFYALTIRQLGGTNFFPPQNVTAEVQNYVDVYMEWTPPAGQEGVLHWDDGEYASGVGLNSAGDWDLAIRFDTADLVPYHNKWITQVDFVPAEVTDFEIKIWTGGHLSGGIGDPGTIVTSQNAVNLTAGEWNSVILDTPVQINASEELWIGYTVTDAGDGFFPAGSDAGPAINYKGNMVNLNNEWISLYDASSELDSNWNLQGLVADSPTRTVDAQPLVQYTPSYATGTFQRSEIGHNAGEVTRSRLMRDLTSYKIYRNDTMIHEITNTAQVAYTDAAVDPGNYSYYMTAMYDNTDESYASNTVYVMVEEVTFDPPTNLHGNINYPNVLLLWDAPEGRGGEAQTRTIVSRDETMARPDVQRYKIYQNGEHIGTQNNPNVTVFNVTGLDDENYEFWVTAEYEGGNESEPSNSFWVYFNDAEDENGVPFVTALQGNYPNPFNPVTEIHFSLSNPEMVEIQVMNVLGQTVRTLVSEQMAAGQHEVVWNGKDDENNNVASGIYFYKMKAGRYTSTKKMILLK